MICEGSVLFDFQFSSFKEVTKKLIEIQLKTADR